MQAKKEHDKQHLKYVVREGYIVCKIYLCKKTVGEELRVHFAIFI